MSNTPPPSAESAAFTEPKPHWIDASVLTRRSGACERDRSAPATSRASALRLVLVGLAGGLIVVGLAATLAN